MFAKCLLLRDSIYRYDAQVDQEPKIETRSTVKERINRISRYYTAIFMVLFHQYVPDKIQGLLSSKIEDRLQRNHEFDQQNVDNHLLLKDCLNASAPTRKQDSKAI